jgi:hypothetical protein
MGRMPQYEVYLRVVYIAVSDDIKVSATYVWCKGNATAWSEKNNPGGLEISLPKFKE